VQQDIPRWQGYGDARPRFHVYRWSLKLADVISSIVSTPERPETARTIAWRRYVDLVFVNAVRTLKVRYRGSILGIFWSLSSPLLMTGVYTLIFGSAFQRYYDNSLGEYILACFAGLAFLNFFATSSSTALGTIVGNGGLLNKVKLPASIFPVAAIAAGTFQLCTGTLPLLAIVAVVTSHQPLNAIALLVPAAGLVLMSLGFGLAAAAVYVHFRDISYLYELVVFILWITSPIFYPAALVPASVRGYLIYNPLAVIIESVRQIALSGSRPSFHLMAGALLSGLVVFIIGSLVYKALRRNFMDLI
jgi:lipopolysaccharide transport system permease protein